MIKKKIRKDIKNIFKKYKTKDWELNGRNYFVVLDVLSFEYKSFSVNDGYFDTFRRYYDEDTASKLVTELNTYLYNKVRA